MPRRLYDKGFKWCKKEDKKFLVPSETIFCPSCNRRLRNKAHQGANADAKRAAKYERAY
jgi:hypothetical protein